MRLITFAKAGETHIGAFIDNDTKIVDLTQAGVADDMNALIRLGSAGLKAARDAVDSASSTIAAGDVKLLAPIPRPHRNVMCVGKNYYDHAAEFHGSGFDSTGKQAVPEFPVIFTKAPTSVTGPTGAITLASDYSNGVTGQRFIGSEWDVALAPDRAATNAAGPAGFAPRPKE